MKYLVTAIFCLLLSLNSIAQDKETLSNRERALGLITRMGETVHSLPDNPLSVKIQLQIADALWKSDEQLARWHFERAYQRAETAELRQDAAALIARCDAELAMRLIENDEQQAERGQVELALRLAGSNPQIAAQIARAGLKKSPNSVSLHMIEQSVDEQTGDPVEAQLPFREAAGDQSTESLNSFVNYTDPQHAALDALASGNFERAIDLIEKLKDAQLRDRLAAIAHSKAATDALRRADLAAAAAHAKQISDPPQRAAIFVEIARMEMKNKAKPRAIVALAEALASIGDAKESISKIRALLLITKTMISIEQARANSVLDSTIEEINRINWDQANNEEVGRSEIGADLGDCLALLAKSNFDEALQVASRIEDKAISALGRLAICRGEIHNKTEQTEPTKMEK